MWIVEVALRRPYTFLVMALLILLATPLVLLKMPTDIFPEINIPVISIVWNYGGLSAQEVGQRITAVNERSLTTTVHDIEHIEYESLSGFSIIKIFFQPNANIPTAISQVVAVEQSQLRQMPPGILPPLVIKYSASAIPVIQLGISSPSMTEQAVFDSAVNFLRPRLVTIPGVAVPWPYGGKQRVISVDLDTDALLAKGLTPNDVVSAVSAQNLVLPSGTAKIGATEYVLATNGSPDTIAGLNSIPVLTRNGATTYLSEVAHVRDGFSPQTNIVRQNGERGVLVSVIKNGGSSTLDIVRSLLAQLPVVEQILPKDLKITPLFDQSGFVRAAISGVVREAVIAACLTAAMILLFLGNWRSTCIIAVSIPLSILSSILALYALGETINLMTLGGLALAVGILGDDATVTIENIERHLHLGSDLHQAILEGAGEIAVPALVSTLCICIVFVPMFFLTGVARYLFVPLAEAVVFAMLASYILSRTLVPTLAMYLLKAKQHDRASSRNPLVRFQLAFERGFERLRNSSHALLTTLVHRRLLFVPVFLLACAVVFLLVPWLGQDFFPSTDSGQFILHVRAKSGTRIEETAKLCDLVEGTIRREIPVREVNNILDNIGLPYSAINFMHSTSGQIGAGDADILVSLNEDHHATEDYIQRLRETLPREYPGATFYFLPSDIVTQVLNFGLPAPVDIQIEGTDIEGNREVAARMLQEVERVPGIADARIQQAFDYPEFDVAVDRTKAAQGGYTQRDVANSLLNSLSGSFQITPMFFLNWKNGVSYNLVTQTPQYSIQSLQDLQNTPLNASTAARPEILADVASIKRANEMEVINHYNIRRVVDIYATVQGRDLGAVGSEVTRIVDANRKSLPRGSFVTVRGQLQTMRNSYLGLLGGLVFSVVLVYLLIVVNFQSWLDPFIIITALPAALAGIVGFLFLTHTTLSVPALMGAIMCMGVGTANSILVVSFAKERLLHHGDPVEAAIEAGFTRFRPVLMTALAMIIGMIPMALGLGEGGEQNAPLGRAVIGGLLVATVATVFFVPAVFAILRGRTMRREADRTPSTPQPQPALP